jgi:hypothetical protein
VTIVCTRFRRRRRRLVGRAASDLRDPRRRTNPTLGSRPHALVCRPGERLALLREPITGVMAGGGSGFWIRRTAA